MCNTNSMKLPRELVTVTPLSKALALLMFIMLPFIGFLFGRQYREEQHIVSTPATVQRPVSPVAISPQMYAPTISPPSYDFSKPFEMEGIGVKVSLPPATAVTMQQENMYVAKMGQDDCVTFMLKDYDRGGRRAWFLKEYPFASKYQIEPFAGRGHEGYIAYAKLPEDTPGGFYYFTVRDNKMFVINGCNYMGAQSTFFTSDIAKFKSFLMSVEFIKTKKVEIEEYDVSHVYRYSEIRKTIWEDKDLGIKLTAPEWTEFRVPSGQYDENGKSIYNGDWSRTYAEGRVYDSQDIGGVSKRIDVAGTFAPYTYLEVLAAKYIGKTSVEVAEDLLLPAGFCAGEWKESKAACSNPDYCYTKADVLQNMIVKSRISKGSLTAELRNLNEAFSHKNDCRSVDTWLIKGKNGHYMRTNLTPDALDFRWEAS